MPLPKEAVKPSEVNSIVKKDHHLIFTDEQEPVLQTDIVPGQVVLLKAIAGAGKTATLIEYMRRRPHKNFLYLAYNRSAIDEARLRIANSGIAVADAENIMCRTIDSLACGSSRVKFRGPRKWSTFWMSSYPALLRRHNRRYPALSKHLLETFDDPEGAYQCGLQVWSMMQDFTLGRDAEPQSESEMPLMHARYMWQSVLKGELESPDFAWTVKAVAELGERLVDLGCPKVDILIVDEAQDINWPMFKIISNQVYAKRSPTAAMMVGDPNQHLYSFRRCISVFEDVEFPREHQPVTYSLTRSCRFGPSIAEYANLLLRSMTSDINVGTIHLERADKVQKVGFNFPRDLGVVCDSVPDGERVAVLFQSNKAMFYCYLNCSVGSIEILGSAFGASTLSALWEQYMINPSEFSTSYRAKSNNLSNTPDPDSAESLRDELFFSEFILGNAKKVPDIINRLRQSVQQNSSAKLVFATVHQAKGREFHTVVLHPGIRECKIQLERKLRQAAAQGGAEHEKLKISVKNFNYLHYTAATRASWKLILP